MLSVVGQNEGTINLQATLSSASAITPMQGGMVLPHAPITCNGRLEYHEDGSFSCEHAIAPPGDVRTRYCVDHSVALLLIEIAKDTL